MPSCWSTFAFPAMASGPVDLPQCESVEKVDKEEALFHATLHAASAPLLVRQEPHRLSADQLSPEEAVSAHGTTLQSGSVFGGERHIFFSSAIICWVAASTAFCQRSEPNREAYSGRECANKMPRELLTIAPRPRSSNAGRTSVAVPP
jgi:hypothetical protein